MRPRPLLCLVILASRLAAASPCNSQPVHMPIKDVQVHPNVAGSYMMGISAKIGTPAQHIVMLPWPELNNTWVYDQQIPCDKTAVPNNLTCSIRRGHQFDQGVSTSFTTASNIVAAGGATVEAGYQGSVQGIPMLMSSAIGGTETFAPEVTDGLTGFPIGIPRLQWDHGFTLLHPLGLGSNSTYLNALRKAGKIGSHVFSIFWGRMWVDDPIDGSVILGGFDMAKTIGANFTAPIDYGDFVESSGCWTGMKVHITNVLVNMRDGSDVSIFAANTNVPACIVPQSQYLMEVPMAILAHFENVTTTRSQGSSSGLHWGAKLYSHDNVFDGDLTIVLSSGLKIRVPNNQFITPHVDMDHNGTRFFDLSKRDLLINGLGSQPATLGRYFLTSAYLMVNHDEKTFTLWQAHPSNSTKLTSVYDKDAAKECLGGGGTESSNASTGAKGVGQGVGTGSDNGVGADSGNGVGGGGDKGTGAKVVGQGVGAGSGPEDNGVGGGSDEDTGAGGTDAESSDAMQAPDPSTSGSRSNHSASMITGGIVGSVVGAAFLGSVAFLLRRARRRRLELAGEGSGNAEPEFKAVQETPQAYGRRHRSAPELMRHSRAGVGVAC